MKKRSESTKLRDEIRLAIKTPFTLSEIPYAIPPESKVFDIKNYGLREWTLLFLDKELFKEIEEACKKRGLNPRYVLYGTFLKLKKMLE